MLVIPSGSGQLTAESLVLSSPVLIKTNSMSQSVTRSVILVKWSHCGAERAEPKGADKPQFSGLPTPTVMSLWCPPKRPGAQNDVPLETRSRTTVPGC